MLFTDDKPVASMDFILGLASYILPAASNGLWGIFKVAFNIRNGRYHPALSFPGTVLKAGLHHNVASNKQQASKGI